jgi:hypothetical protein
MAELSSFEEETGSPAKPKIFTIVHKKFMTLDTETKTVVIRKYAN